MINSANRKNEIFLLAANINKFQTTDEKNQMAAISFPRLYGHYEKYTKESINYFFNKIFEANPTLSDIDNRIVLFFLSMQNLFIGQSNKQQTKLLEEISNINDTYQLTNMNKSLIFTNLKNIELHQQLRNILEIFCFNNFREYSSLVTCINAITSKNLSRNAIAHGDEDLSCFNLSDFMVIKDKILIFFDLLNDAIEEYLEDELYKSNP